MRQQGLFKVAAEGSNTVSARDWMRHEAKERLSRCCERNISASERLVKVVTAAEVRRLD